MVGVYQNWIEAYYRGLAGHFVKRVHIELKNTEIKVESGAVHLMKGQLELDAKMTLSTSIQVRSHQLAILNISRVLLGQRLVEMVTFGWNLLINIMQKLILMEKLLLNKGIFGHVKARYDHSCFSFLISILDSCQSQKDQC